MKNNICGKLAVTEKKEKPMHDIGKHKFHTIT